MFYMFDSNFVDSTTHEKRKFITKCNHLYHHDCIYRWAQQKIILVLLVEQVI